LSGLYLRDGCSGDLRGIMRTATLLARRLRCRLVLSGLDGGRHVAHSLGGLLVELMLQMDRQVAR
jgi:hypothetical protein